VDGDGWGVDPNKVMYAWDGGSGMTRGGGRPWDLVLICRDGNRCSSERNCHVRSGTTDLIVDSGESTH
jgi:hypothetical protein